MPNKHLKLEPHKITDRCWWYEQSGGIKIYVENTDDEDKYSHTEEYLIPWKHIRAALKRKDLPKPGKVKK